MTKPTKLKVKATVCGSFNRFLEQVADDVANFRDLGVEVLSPKVPRATAEERGFIYVASDVERGVRQVQDKHLRAIADSNFVWLRCPNGYVGLSAAMEIGFAAAAGIPVFADAEPECLDLSWRVRVVGTPAEAVRIMAEEAHTDTPIVLEAK